MLKKKKKLSKKEIKQDKLVEFYYKAYGFFEDNKSRVLTFGIVAIVIAAALVFYFNHNSEENTEAGIQLANVLQSYDQGAYLNAIEGQAGTNIIGLKKIVAQYGGTENGETAKIYLANSYNRLGKPGDAFKYYKDYDGSIPMYKATAYAGQAGYYADKKEYEKAADLYRKAASVSETDVLNSDYLLNAGINYINAGEKSKAKSMFEKIKKDYASSTADREVNKYMELVD